LGTSVEENATRKNRGVCVVLCCTQRQKTTTTTTTIIYTKKYKRKGGKKQKKMESPKKKDQKKPQNTTHTHTKKTARSCFLGCFGGEFSLVIFCHFFPVFNTLVPF